MKTSSPASRSFGVLTTFPWRVPALLLSVSILALALATCGGGNAPDNGDGATSRPEATETQATTAPVATAATQATDKPEATDEPAETTATGGDFLSVSAGGGGHNCDVKEDGSVACWGWNDSDQATPPAGTFLSVSAGFDHTCGVEEGGSVACWGEDRFCEATPP